MKPKLVVLSGAGISAESGVKTFRDANGLWEGHDIMEVASPEGWNKNPHLVLDFYNQRRKQLLDVQPNNAHLLLKQFEDKYDITIITQNVDDLHERAGSSKVVHLHGELLKVRSTGNPSYIKNLEGWELKLGDNCPDGFQLRPHIVWFGEAVPMIEVAQEIVATADIFVIIGTSMQVYPAAGLIDYTKNNCKVFCIDKTIPTINSKMQVTKIEETASKGVELLFTTLENIL